MSRAFPLWVRAALMAALAIPDGACTSWKTQTVSPDQVLAKNPDQVRVTRADGSTRVLVQPSIAGDSLIGVPPGDPARRIAGRVAIPLADVQSVAVQRINAGRTALLIAGAGITALAIIAAATDDPPEPPPHPTVSCPLVYSWDGHSWRLDSGTFGGAIAPALARTDVDNLLYATSRNGLLRLRVANELNETDYLDALSVLAVDHAPGISVAPDEEGRIYALGALASPLSAKDDRGGDALPRVRAADGWGWESNPTGRDTAVAGDIRDGIELAFLKPATADARLVVDANNTPWAAHLTEELVAAHGRETRAWYDSLGSRPASARELGTMMAREAFLAVSVWSSGQWLRQGYIWEAGPEIVKRQVFPLDLSRVTGDTVRIRLESAPSFWLIDHVALAAAQPDRIRVTELRAESAREQNGADVGPLLRSLDRQYYIMENGASAELRFRVPDVPPGRARSYLVHSSGWYRIHTAEKKTPDIALLHRVLTEPYGASRVSVGRLNDALAAMEPRP